MTKRGRFRSRDEFGHSLGGECRCWSMHRQDVTHGPHTPQHEEARLINPSENANNQRFVARLRLEVEAWLQDGTVTAEQAQAILARYPAYVPGYEASRRRQSLVVGLSILGAILIGLSVITFFAANWDEISRSVKLGSLIVGMALSYGSGYYLWNRAGYGAYAVALVLLGCIIYGAGVHLIGQIYHIDVEQPQPLDVLVPRHSAPGLRHPFPPGDGPCHRSVPGRRGLPIGSLVGGGFRLKYCLIDFARGFPLKCRHIVCGPLPFTCSVPLRDRQSEGPAQRVGINRRPLPGLWAACRLRSALPAYLP